MGWTSPRTWVTGEMVTAAMLNEQVRDNLNMAFPAASAASVATSQGTTSASFTDLATVGPAVTLDTRTSALVIVSARVSAPADFAYMGFAVSGASTIAASDDLASIYAQDPDEGYSATITGMFIATGLTAGSNTFTCKYHVTAGVSTTWSHRTIAVVKL